MPVMNGEIPSTPITTLAGVASLTDLLPELPLPSASSQLENKSLLHNQRIAQEAQRYLASRDPGLVSQLVSALGKSSTENIILNEHLNSEHIHGNSPPLLQEILAYDQNIFHGSGSHYNAAHHNQGFRGAPGMLPPGAGTPLGLNHYGSNAMPDPCPALNGDVTNGPVGGPAINTHSTNDLLTQGQNPYASLGVPPAATAAPATPEVYHLSSGGRTRGVTDTDKAAKQNSKQGASSKASRSDQSGRSPQAEGSNDAVYNVSAIGENRLTLKISINKNQIHEEPKGRKRKRIEEEEDDRETKHDDKRVRERDRDRRRDRERDKDRDRDRDRVKDRERDRDRDRDKVKDRVGERDRERDRDRDRGKDKERERDKERDRESRREREKDKDKDKIKKEVQIERVKEEKTDEKVKSQEKECDRIRERDRNGHDRKSRGEKPERIPTPVKELQELYATSLGDRVKRRRRTPISTYAEEGDESKPTEVTDAEPSSSHQNQSNADAEGSMALNAKKKKEKKSKKGIELMITLEDITEQPTYKRFMVCLEGALESAEDMDISTFKDNDDEDEDGPAESLVSRSLLIDLCSEAAKLKATGAMNMIPHEKLVKLLAILLWTIKDGCKVVPAANPDDGKDAEQLWRELAMEKVLAAVDAGLTALYVMTSPRMPKEVYLEDVIEKLVMMAKVQLQNTIYPEFDPVYRVDPSAKDGFQGNMRMKRAHAKSVKHRSTLSLYNKLVDLISNLAELIGIQQLTDTIILQVSTLAVTPFFVENISELQLNSLKLVSSVFSRYDKHRQLILEDIFTSLARLPSSKRNLRSYRLNAEDNIQMVTALVLELIQCVVKLPKPVEIDHLYGSGDANMNTVPKFEVDQDVVIVTSYETAMRTAHNFLAVFLKKCTTKGEEDYRPIFEHFVYDLLATVNKPEWPAAELLLSLLGRLLVHQFSNKSVDMSLRVASLDYLGTVAARLRKDAVTSRLSEESIKEIVQEILDDEEETTEKKKDQGEADRGQYLQKGLLQYLWSNLKNDPSLIFSVQFYVAQWYRDSTTEMDRQSKHHDQNKELADEVQSSTKILQIAERRKNFLLKQCRVHQRNLKMTRQPHSPLDYEEACLAARYLAANRPFSQSFDIYLSQILKVLSENAVAVRTKAMKCLTAVVEADPAILARVDMQKGVHGRFLDHSTSVREAAVELVGKFILVRPELTAQYYDMLSDRILDKGISVRKRVIKIFRDICIEQPEFDKIPEMCVRMIRRVNDEDGIKKLVNEVFQEMWFVPMREKDSGRLLNKVMNITDVVSTCRETGSEWFEQLVDNLIKKEEDLRDQPVHRACEQIVDCLVDNVLRLEEIDDEPGSKPHKSRLVACLSTLYMFCKVKPELLVHHATTIHPYLNIKCSSQVDYLVLHNVAKILELALPLMDHPSETFLAQLEEDMMKLILKHGMLVLQSCVSCLGAVVNEVTHNYKLVRDCFQKFFGVLSKMMEAHKKDPNFFKHSGNKAMLMRALFTVGLLCKHFDFDSKDMGETRAVQAKGRHLVCIREKVYNVMTYYIHCEDEEIQHKALVGMGFFLIKQYEYMMNKELRDLYHELLTTDRSIKLKLQVLRNIQSYLMEEEENMIKADAAWRKNANKEDLKEMGDIQSGMASTIMQVYLKQVLEALFCPSMTVRLAATSVVCLVLHQGLVQPVQCVPYLIAMGTDADANIRIKADQQLQEMEKKYPGFVQMKALAGIKMSYKVQQLLQDSSKEPVRGVLGTVDDNNIQSCNSFIYTFVRTSRGHRRALLTSMLNMFDDTAKFPLRELVYMADNLACFPYQIQDEPLYIIHQIDIIVSVSGSNIVQSFREYFYKNNMNASGRKLDEDEDDEIDTIIRRIQDIRPLQELVKASQGCILLLTLKQYLKELYGLKDNKIHQYSPTDSSKAYEKPISRKVNVKFDPKTVLDMVKEEVPEPEEADNEYKRKVVQDYIDFKALMMSIDPSEDDEDEEGGQKLSHPPATSSTSNGQPAADGAEGAEHQGDLNTSGESVASAGAETPHHKHHHSHSHASTPQVPAVYRHLLGGSSHKSTERKSRTPHVKQKPKIHKKKKRKRKRYAVESDEESDDSDSDPDFMV